MLNRANVVKMAFVILRWRKRSEYRDYDARKRDIGDQFITCFPGQRVKGKPGIANLAKPVRDR